MPHVGKITRMCKTPQCDYYHDLRIDNHCHRFARGKHCRADCKYLHNTLPGHVYMNPDVDYIMADNHEYRVDFRGPPPPGTLWYLPRSIMTPAHWPLPPIMPACIFGPVGNVKVTTAELVHTIIFVSICAVVNT